MTFQAAIYRGSFIEFEKYLTELVGTRKEEIRNGTTPMSDILSALVRGYYSSVKGEELRSGKCSSSGVYTHHEKSQVCNTAWA